MGKRTLGDATDVVLIQPKMGKAGIVSKPLFFPRLQTDIMQYCRSDPKEMVQYVAGMIRPASNEDDLVDVEMLREVMNCIIELADPFIPAPLYETDALENMYYGLFGVAQTYSQLNHTTGNLS